MKKDIIKLVALLVLGAAVLIGAFSLADALKSINPPVPKPENDVGERINSDNSPFVLLADFSLELFADDLPDARSSAL